MTLAVVTAAETSTAAALRNDRRTGFLLMARPSFAQVVRGPVLGVTMTDQSVTEQDLGEKFTRTAGQLLECRVVARRVVPPTVRRLRDMAGPPTMTIDLSTVSLDTVIAGVALLGTIVAWLFDRFLLRRRRLVYRVQVDTPIGVHPQAHKDKVDVAVSYQKKEIADPSIVLIRIDNPGVDIEPEHFETPLTFEFPDREIAGLEVTRANSDDIVTAVKERLAEAEKLGPMIQDNKLFVPRLAINHGHGFKFLLVLSGKGRGVRHAAYPARRTGVPGAAA